MPQPAAAASGFWRKEASEKQKHTSSQRCCKGGNFGCFSFALFLTINLFQWLFITGGGDT